MKASDLFSLALRGVGRDWKRCIAALLLLAVGIGSMCFGFTLGREVYQEKSLPSELRFIATAEGELTEEARQKALETEVVLAASLVLEVPITLVKGENSVFLTATGIDASMLQEETITGNLFPESDVMPYLVLDGASAQKLFGYNQAAEGGAEQAVEEEVELYMGAIAPVEENTSSSQDVKDGGSAAENAAPVPTQPQIRNFVAKISGVLQREEAETTQQAQSFMGLGAARKLLQENNQAVQYAGLAVRMENWYAAPQVMAAMETLHLQPQELVTQQQEAWAAQEKETGYLLSSGGLVLLAGALLLASQMGTALTERKKLLYSRYKLGMAISTQWKILLLQGAFLGLAAGLAGSLLALLMPYLVGASTTAFTLGIPADIVLLAIAVTTLAGGLAHGYASRKIRQLL